MNTSHTPESGAPAAMDPQGHGNAESRVVSNRTMEIAVAIALMVVATIVMIDMYRLGAGWAKDVGPDSGYFPFYVALIMFASSGVILVQALMARTRDAHGGFIDREQLKRVFQVLVPMTVFVVLSIYIGIYISTFLFMAFFMTWHGRFPWYKTLPISILLPIVLFIVFEVWFLVPLPKGPFEAWLGY